jgi:hypothetical protein
MLLYKPASTHLSQPCPHYFQELKTQSPLFSSKKSNTLNTTKLKDELQQHSCRHTSTPAVGAVELMLIAPTHYNEL